MPQVALKMESFDSEHADSRTARAAARLASAFEAGGFEARVRHMDGWGEDDLDADLVVHVGGHIRYALKKWNVNLLILTGPDVGLSVKEIMDYDAVLANGPQLASALIKAGMAAVPAPGALDRPEPAAAKALSLYASLDAARDRAGRARQQAERSRREGPLVSVLMSTYDRPLYLPAAIRSVLGQTYSNLELVLVNDGGRDVSGIVRDFGDERLRLVSLPERGGKARAINLAFASSRGEYVAYLDDDDIWYPEHLESLMPALTGIEGVRMAHSDAWRVDMAENGSGFREAGRELVFHHQVDIYHLIENNFITGISVCHDRALFHEAGGMDERLSALIDWDLWRRMAALTEPYHVSKVTAEYFMRGGRATSGKGHITNLHLSDPPRYYAHRALILNKRLGFARGSALEKELGRARLRSRLEFLKARAQSFMDLGRTERALVTLGLAERLMPRATETGSEHGQHLEISATKVTG